MQTCKYNRILTSLPLAATLLLGGCNWGVLDPQGPIGEDERPLIVEATLLMLVIVVPVIVLVVAFAWRYRASNTRSPIAHILPGKSTKRDEPGLCRLQNVARRSYRTS